MHTDNKNFNLPPISNKFANKIVDLVLWVQSTQSPNRGPLNKLENIKDENITPKNHGSASNVSLTYNHSEGKITANKKQTMLNITHLKYFDK